MIRKRVIFKFNAPDAKGVFLTDTFNSWNKTSHRMAPDGIGNWGTTMVLPKGVYEYRFVVDDMWQNDPNCKEMVANEFGSENCMIRV